MYASEAGQRDFESLACLNIWCEVLLRASLDAQRKSQRNYHRRPRPQDATSAMQFFCGKHFITIATLIGLDPDVVRNRFVPLSFQREYATRQIARSHTVAPTVLAEENQITTGAGQWQSSLS
jgi:hypothetical protein